MIINKITILFLCTLFGKINTKIILENAGKYGNYNSATELKFVNVTNENGKQYIFYRIYLAEDLDQKIGVIFSLEYAANKKRFITIRTFKEKNACRALNAYGGEPWMEMQKSAGIPVKICPIKAGDYKINHMEIDLDKLAFQAIPVGKVRVNITLIHNSGQIPILSSFMEITRA